MFTGDKVQVGKPFVYMRLQEYVQLRRSNVAQVEKNEQKSEVNKEGDRTDSVEAQEPPATTIEKKKKSTEDSTPVGHIRTRETMGKHSQQYLRAQE